MIENYTKLRKILSLKYIRVFFVCSFFFINRIQENKFRWLTSSTVNFLEILGWEKVPARAVCKITRWSKWGISNSPVSLPGSLIRITCEPLKKKSHVTLYPFIFLIFLLLSSATLKSERWVKPLRKKIPFCFFFIYVLLVLY